MKIKDFTDEELGALAEFLSDENVVVKKILLSPRLEEYYAGTFFVFYEYAEEQLAREKRELSNLDKIAQELEKDDDYAKLKNSTQREIFLLQKYDLSSGLAKRTIELVNVRKNLSKKVEEG